MKRLQKLINLSNYLATFSVPGHQDITPKRVVDGDNATHCLAKASGQQLLIALPEGSDSGQNTDSFRETVSLAFFALEKINGPARTQETADRTYNGLLVLCQDVLDKLSNDIIGAPQCSCPILAGMNITEVDVTPIYSSFGGWSGWSVELLLE